MSLQFYFIDTCQQIVQRFTLQVQNLNIYPEWNNTPGMPNYIDEVEEYFNE